MKFKIDENLPVDVVESLRNAGYDAATVWDEHLNGAPDTEIADVCKREERALITLDTDFANIQNYPPQQFPGLIVLRLQRQDKRHVLKMLERLIPVFETEPIQHLLWIVDETHIRIR